MSAVIVVVGGWLGLNVLFALVAFLRQGPDGDRLDAHEILDAAQERDR